MCNPAFIVDGFTEKLIIGRLCPGKPVRRTDLNGKDVSIEAIANKVASLIRLLNNRYYPIIVVIDREERKEDIQSIIDKLLAELNKRGLNKEDIRINVADRKIENWIIADWEIIGDIESKPKDTDGLNGVAIIKKNLRSYTKTTDGVDLFIKANPSIIYKNSPSYKRFIDSLEGIKCQYTQFEKI